MIDERIVLATNQQGLPLLARSADHMIDIRLSENTESGTSDVEIAGDELALRRLAEVLIAVSKTQGYHLHIDSCCETTPLIINPDRVRLTVSNLDRPPIRQASSQPPDWAR